MTEADVQRLLAEKKIRTVSPDPETAQAEIDVARRHIASAEKIMADDSTLAFTALYDAMRKAIAAHMRSRGYRVSRGPGAHAKTGEYSPTDGAAQESNLPSLGLPDLTGFEDRLGHRARAAPSGAY